MKSVILIYVFLLLSNIVIGQYDYYTSDGNLFTQRVIETNDGGLLIGSYENCFTPGSVTLDGCIYAIFLIKTDAEGDTIWTNSVSFSTQYGRGINMFENDDNTFTIITITNNATVCAGFIISGVRKIEVLNLDSSGEIINEVTFPDNCELIMKDIVRLDNNKYVILAYYDEPIFIEPEGEGRLFLMDNSGNISNEVVFPEEKFKGGMLLRTGPNEVLLTDVDDDGNMIFKEFDTQLNLLNETINTALDYSCFQLLNNKKYAKKLTNGNLMLFCYEGSSTYQNSHFFIFDDSFDLIFEKTSTLLSPTNFIEGVDNEIVNASRNEVSSSVTNSQINYFNVSGDSLSSTIIYGLEKERPSEIMNFQNSRFVVVGSANCCSGDIAPTKTFLTIQEYLTSSVRQNVKLEDVKINPNPTSNEITIDIRGYEGVVYEFDFQLYATTGNLVLEKRGNIGNAHISLDKLVPGIYFYKILTNKEEIKQGKIIKSGS